MGGKKKKRDKDFGNVPWRIRNFWHMLDSPFAGEETKMTQALHLLLRVSPMLFSYIINKPVFPIVGCPLCTKNWMEKTQWWGVLYAVHWNQFYRKSHFTQSELMCIGLLEKAAKHSVRNNHQDWEGLSCWFSGVWGVTRTCVRIATWSRVILRVFSIK